MTIVDAIRQPQYTGENRCIPCTVVNLCIATVLSGLVGLVSIPAAGVTFVVAVGAIYLRGYLVPGTPAFTKRYFPAWLLRWFDKEPEPAYAVPTDVEGDEDFDVEAALLGVGALELSENPGDLSLDSEFRERWYGTVADLDERRALETLAGMLGVPRSALSTEDRGQSYAVRVDHETAGKWESRQSLMVDMAGERVLSERAENWSDLPVERRSGLLRSLRVYLDRCPRCDGPVTLSEETRKSCCRSREVYACSCQNCSIRLFEMNASQVEDATT